MAMTKVKKLQMWCEKLVEGYPEVTVTNMTSSWKNGLACCAIIHRFRPDLIDFDSLSKENVFENNQLAFEVAENELGIPALLEAADMVAIKVPDRLSVVTYVSQYYNYFHDKPQLGGPGVRKAASLKRHQSPEGSSGPQPKRLTPQKPDNDQTTVKKKTQGSIGDKCTICHEKVYLLERLIESNKLYHRTCFRHSDLAPTSKIYARPNTASPEGPDAEPSYWQQRARNSEKSTNLAARLNELKKCTASSKPAVDQSHISMKIDNKDVDDSTQKKILWKQPNSFNTDLGSKSNPHSTDTIGQELTVEVSPHRRPGKTDTAEPMDTSPVSPRGKSPVTSRGKSPVSSRGKSPVSPRGKSPVSPGGKLKPRATPRGSIKAKDNLKSVAQPDSVTAPPRKKSSKSVSPAKSSGAVSPPALPTSMPPSLQSIGVHNQDFQNPTSPSLMPSSAPSTRGPSAEPPLPSTRHNHSAALTPSPRPRSPPRLKSPSNSESPRETSTSPMNHKTARNRTASPKNLLSTTDPQSVKNRPVVSSNKDKQDLMIDNAPPKPPRSLPRGTTPKDMEQATQLSDPHSTSPQPVTPGTRPQEDRSKNVLSGLLKNLANVRNKGDGATENSPPKLNTSDISHNNRPNLVSDSKEPKPRVMRKAVIPLKKPEAKPSTDIEMKDAGVKGMVGTAEQTGKYEKGMKASEKPKFENKPLNEIHSGDNVPLRNNRGGPQTKTNEDDGEKYSKWKGEEKTTKDVENLDDKKTKDILGVKDRPARPKTPKFLSRKNVKDEVTKLPWQLEAEKRMANRVTDTQIGTHKSAGNKTDLGKHTVTEDKTAQKEETSSKKPEGKSKVLPIPPSEINTDKPGKSRQNLKKIAVDVKFNFEETSFKEDSPKSPPPRPPRPSSQDIREPRRSIKKRRSPNTPGSPGWLKDGDFRKMTPQEIQKQLNHIDSKLTDLEIRGRHLEDSIRKAPEEDETMMMEWFQMVNDKNELVRKEADLIYASRTQELEDEQQDIDRQIRELLEKPEGEKTEEEKQEEELLLQKLIDVVNQRSIIVDSQDEDRIRYQEEDRDIAVMLENKGFVQKIH